MTKLSIIEKLVTIITIIVFSIVGITVMAITNSFYG